MDLSKLPLEELLIIRKIVESQELQIELEKVIEKKEQEKLLPEEYQSDRLPEFYSQYEEQCLELLSQLNYYDVEFFPLYSFRAAGNNKGGDFRMIRSNIYQSGWKSLNQFEPFFKENSSNIYLYEGVFNTWNYIKTSICNKLDKEKNINTKEDLLKDYKERQELVKISIRNISKELLNLRLQVPNSRLSVANQGLNRTANKIGEQVTYNQKLFIQALAFGMSLEDLQKKNYEGAKRLLYVPR